MFCLISYFNIFLSIYLLLILSQITIEVEQIESISTRSTRAEGILLCGKLPIKGAYIRLFKSNSDDLKDVLATATTTEVGKYIIAGNTANYQGTEANIDPFLRIYHKCDDKEGKKGYRQITLRYPREYVTLGRVPRRLYNLGTMNVQLEYPGEKRIEELKGI
uniref:Transthyretin-like family protein n=1 Tax=Meloidogyne incognita TaxID=6306 RepID=A0A914M3S7_MELIC